MKWTIKEIKEKLVTVTDPQNHFLQMLKEDERKGVRTLVQKWFNEQEKQKILQEKFTEMFRYEQKYYTEGYRYIAGIDEVGRGPLAGPVVAAAVILPKDFRLLGIDDSKKLSEQKREDFFAAIHEKAISVGVGIVDNNEIDHLNIYAATKRAMLSAIEQCNPSPDFLLIDAVELETACPSQPIIKGDSLSISIAAASIIAKVTRDRILKDYDAIYPEYGFARNAGYGTKEHLQAIENYGITPIHRKSFAPVKEYINSRG